MYSNNSTLSGLTISAGSTVATPNNTTTTLAGTITNNGTITLNSVGNGTSLLLSGNVTLNGTGTLALSNNVSNQVYGSTGSEQLTNGAGHTIEGSGQIGVGQMSLINNGTILANQPSALTIEPNATGAVNNGTFQVNSGSSLVVNGSFTTAGMVNIGQAGSPSASLFQMVGSNDYVQTGGTTSLWTSSSTLAVGSNNSVDLKGGTLEGIGTISGNLSNTGGTILPGTAGVAGILTVTGNYSDPQASLDIQIGGSTPGSEFSQLNVLGDASLGGTLDVSLINGFTHYNGEQFVILTSAGLSGTFVNGVIHDGNITFTVAYSPAGYTNDVVLNVGIASVPEPASLLLLGLGVAGMGAWAWRTRRAV